jgi:diguanylate cyclase (GGDEF)-like protein
MHFMGIGAMDIGSRTAWDPAGVVIAIFIGLTFGSASAMLLVRLRGIASQLAAAGTLALGILGLHFVAMAALTILPAGAATPELTGAAPKLLALTVAFGAFGVVCLGFAAALLDQQIGGRKLAELKRIRALADATFEGLVIVRDEVILDINHRMIEMLDLRREDLLGLPANKLATNIGGLALLGKSGDPGPHQTRLQRRNGTCFAVQILVREVDFDGLPACVFAIRDVSIEERAKAEIMHMAHHDALTGLPNRLCFQERLVEAINQAGEAGSDIALIAFDLDRFKEVNDVHGHAAGDALLVAVADRFRDALPNHATIARLSGDEFAVILPNIPGRIEAIAVSQRAVNLVGKPFEFRNAVINVSASAGLTMFPMDGEDPDQLMQQADLALYRAKHQGRNCLCEFDPELGAIVHEKRSLESALKLAVEDELLDLHYQPQLDMDSGEIIGFEALLRWEDSVRGAVSPTDFVRLAEETGLILKMGQWVLVQACLEAVAWPGQERVSVNVSPAQFKQGNLVQAVQQALRTSGLHPSRLEIEITEGVLIDDEARALTLLQHLRDLGVSTAIDDFGTGFASLNYLRAFPFNKIKIDRAFMAGIQDDLEAQIIVRATINLAHDLGMGVVVEGVESYEELEVLGEQTNLLLQGYLLSPPLTRGQIPAFLLGSKSRRSRIVQACQPTNRRDVA